MLEIIFVNPAALATEMASHSSKWGANPANAGRLAKRHNPH